MTAAPGKRGPSGPVLVIAGPTASGKSALALALAEAVGGVIVNADSMQVYRELCVLTARPDAAALARVPHRLYGVLSAAEACSAGRWRALALGEIAAAHGTGALPVLVGGTGLYLKALMTGLAELPEIPATVREAAGARHDALGGAAFHAELAVRDPAMAARLRPSDRQRLIRAWEVIEATGRSLADWQAGTAGAGDMTILPVLVLPPRAALYTACDARVEAMVAGGALDEVRALLALGLDPALPAMKAIGVRELGAVLAGSATLAEAAGRMQRATRNYAKRQLTWLRHQMPPPGPIAAGTLLPQIVIEHAVSAHDLAPGAQLLESLKARIFNFIRHSC
ncbi:MAG TPA: tRNA (adenosine(37)-N6)-dimethylallyltransferase MiaA [Alphaproteobacteria bacterium]|nr:tRNA (adenosine(37)-N6)-dimethylallyltransferase MiaA [Alphaproteobacteria bacterium]